MILCLKVVVEASLMQKELMAVPNSEGKPQKGGQGAISNTRWMRRYVITQLKWSRYLKHSKDAYSG
jgi:hypothetical protein